MSSEDFKFWTLGGSGEVGMNSLVLQMGETILPIDAGVLFADANDFGIENLHADYEEFFRQHDPQFWIITHAHEDHIGATAALINAAIKIRSKAPIIYAPVFACELIREKVLEDSRYDRAHQYVNCLREVNPGETIEPLEGLKIQFIEGRHSTLQSCALAIEWADKFSKKTRILHTSDFKIDENSYEDGVKGLDIYSAFGEEEVDFLLVDSTNSEREGWTVPEKIVIPNLKKLIDMQEGRVFVSLFSSNVYRMASIMALAKEINRAVCLAGRSFNTVHRVASRKALYDKYCPSFSGVEITSPEEIVRRERNKQLIVCSGSQGERRSVLNRISSGQHPYLKVEPGDAVILSSKTIPGNEKSISRMINGLLRQGAHVYWGDYAKVQAGGPIHGSGHARRDEIRAVVDRVRPKHIIPVHGELRQIKSCAELCLEVAETWREKNKLAQVHVCENLTALNFERQNGNGDWEKASEEVMSYQGRILRFDNFTAHSLDPFLRVRKRSAQGGVVSLCISSNAHIALSFDGVMPVLGERASQNIEALKEKIEEWAQVQFKGLQREGVFSLPELKKHEDDLADELSRFVRRITGVRPFVICHLVSVL
jgi:ribonuclease J